MTYRRCKNPHPLPEGEEPVTLEEVIEYAIEAFGWSRAKVKSWTEKENPRLKKSRPRELCDRNQGYMVIEFLEEKREERITNQQRNMEKK